MLPDVSHESSASITGRLQKVGMENIELPVKVATPNGELLLPAKLSAFVNLDNENAKGIHMSRLYVSLQQRLAKNVLSFDLIQEILDEFVSGQQGLSSNSFFQARFQMPVERKALKSGQLGWRHYDVEFFGDKEGDQLKTGFRASVIYSSTCPCSAALARQLISEEFIEQNGDKEMISTREVSEWLEKESSIVATPHAQRSEAELEIVVDPNNPVSPLEVIDAVEGILGTPVQAAVKRQDEQEFARLNGSNLMFCEDAGRRIQSVLEKNSSVLDYSAKISHRESLHPHDAVSFIRKVR